MDDLAEMLRHAEERGIDLSQLAKKQNGDVRNTKENRRRFMIKSIGTHRK
jgi:hypothetical protein